VQFVFTLASGLTVLHPLSAFGRRSVAEPVGPNAVELLAVGPQVGYVTGICAQPAGVTVLPAHPAGSPSTVRPSQLSRPVSSETRKITPTTRPCNWAFVAISSIGKFE
jgi:hypothetical protein